MYALVDCNNFYASCERLFNPKLNNRPVVVLSNNDGCVIARSDEAKQVGIAMGTPVFMMKDLINQHKVAVCSSNYTLYGDLSDRVMQTMSSLVPRIEIYSIDEAFLDLQDIIYTDLLQLGMTLRNTVKQNTGIPVSVGIAPTKTLAKMANRYAKKKCKDVGVFWAANDDLVQEMLDFTDIGDVWGIGRQYAAFLQKNGFNTALDFVTAPEEWIRKNMTVVGQRMLNELKGIPAIQSLYEPRAKKNICTSRSFGKLLTAKNEIKIAVANYAAQCAAKLRKQKTCCSKVHVFVNTNPHKTEEAQYYRSITIQLEVATNSSSEIIKQALKAFDIIFKEGYRYMKCGVIVMDFITEAAVQSSLFAAVSPTVSKVMKAMDSVNKTLGNELVRMASQGFERRYKLRAEYLSPCYTTNMQQLLRIKI